MVSHFLFDGKQDDSHTPMALIKHDVQVSSHLPQLGL